MSKLAYKMIEKEIIFKETLEVKGITSNLKWEEPPTFHSWRKWGEWTKAVMEQFNVPLIVAHLWLLFRDFIPEMRGWPLSVFKGLEVKWFHPDYMVT